MKPPLSSEVTSSLMGSVDSEPASIFSEILRMGLWEISSESRTSWALSWNFVVDRRIAASLFSIM